MDMASSFVPRVVFPWTLPLWDTLWNEWITSPPCTLGALLDRCSSAVCLQVVCWSSLQQQHSSPWALSEASLLTFGTTGFKPRWLPEVTKFSQTHTLSAGVTQGNARLSFKRRKKKKKRKKQMEQRIWLIHQPRKRYIRCLIILEIYLLSFIYMYLYFWNWA